MITFFIMLEPSEANGARKPHSTTYHRSNC